MYHVFSTAANSTEFVRYAQTGQKGINVAAHTVLIKGGSGINKKHIGTPLGIHTAVSDEDMEWLKDDFSFKQHIKNGYITVRKTEVNPEVAAAEMVTHNQKTDACPIVPEDFSGKEIGNGLTAIKPSTSKKAKAA